MRTLKPVNGFRCAPCGGTGAKTVHADGSHTRCWHCNGNGLDPAEYFRWGNHPPLKAIPTIEEAI